MCIPVLIVSGMKFLDPNMEYYAMLIVLKADGLFDVAPLLGLWYELFSWLIRKFRP